ncbi:tyrosine-type recombinase/integrase [Catellatospora paridis]
MPTGVVRGCRFAATFLTHVHNDRLYTMWRLLLVTGLRRGELAGMKWEDFDSATGTVRVVRQRVVEGDDSVVREKRPKSPNSVRTIMIDKVRAEILGWMRPAGGSA